MQEIIAYRQDLLLALQGVVRELSKTVATIPSSAWHIQFGLDSHTPHYTLAHLRELEVHVFTSQLCSILDEETPLLPVFDDEAWMASHYKPDEPAQKILEEFAHQRELEITCLRDLLPREWSRTARHPWLGLHTLQWWVELQLDYSLQHLRQLTAACAM